MSGAWSLNELPVPLLVKSTLGLAAILLLVAGGILIIRRVRTRSEEDIVTPHQMLTEFRELHAQGRLSDEEFQSIRSRMIEDFHSEVKKDDKSR